MVSNTTSLPTFFKRADDKFLTKSIIRSMLKRMYTIPLKLLKPSMVARPSSHGWNAYSSACEKRRPEKHLLKGAPYQLFYHILGEGGPPLFKKNLSKGGRSLNYLLNPYSRAPLPILSQILGKGGLPFWSAHTHKLHIDLIKKCWLIQGGRKEHYNTYSFLIVLMSEP